jgi:myosin heavy subunit
MYSLPGEDEREFRLRLQHELRERRDRKVDGIERRFASKIRRVSDRLDKALQALEKKKAVASSRKSEVLISLGESLLGAFMGRRSMRTASSTMSKYRMSRTATMSIKEAEETVSALKGEMQSLEDELKAKTAEVVRELEESVENLERFPVTPRRADIDVGYFGLAWVPYWRISFRDSAGQVRTEDLPAA